MIKIICLCDKCGKEIEQSRVVKGLDFCEDCYTALCDVIQAWIDEPKELPFVDVPVSQEVVKESQEVVKKVAKKVSTKMVKKTAAKKKPIDWDKACALKNAGWSNAKIADELGINPGTVSVEIYKKVKAFNERKAMEEEQAKQSVLEV